MAKPNLPHHHHEDETSTTYCQEQLSKTLDFEIVSDIFKQLGDPNRVKIFWLLCHIEECVINISALVNMSSPAVSHHLSKLKASGLIVSFRKGKEVYYSAANTKQVQLLHEAIENTMAISCFSDEMSKKIEI